MKEKKKKKKERKKETKRKRKRKERKDHLVGTLIPSRITDQSELTWL